MNIEEKLSRGFELLQEKDIDHSLDIAREVKKKRLIPQKDIILRRLLCNS